MAITKGRQGKFTKKSTDLSTPAIVRPKISSASQTWMGAADVDNNNPETFYFHLFGSVPAETTLFVYGDLYNQAFYTELGLHNHVVSITSGTSNQSFNHTHVVSIDFGAHNHGDHNLATITGWLKGADASTPTSASMPNSTHNHALESDGSASGFGDHRHTLGVDNGDGGQKIDIDGGTLVYRTTFPTTGNFIMGTNQVDTRLTPVRLNASFTSNSQANNTLFQVMQNHTHLVSGNTASVGLAPIVGSVHTSGTAHSYFNALKIEIDGVDVTAPLLVQAGLAAFGDGTAGHVIVTTGVELDISAYVSVPGQHKVKFLLNTLSPNNGGKVRYNLYTL